MAPKSYKVSVPGSMMLLGEHAVLYGKQAVVCAVNQRLRMTLTPTDCQQVVISDTRLGTVTQNLAALQVQEPFTFVISAILLFRAQINRGFTLEIESDFASNLGLGSSAAVTVATIAALGAWLNQGPLPAGAVFDFAKQVMFEVQGSGSGADLAASVFGGVLSYSMHPSTYAQLPTIPNLTAVYCGYKTPTSVVIKHVKQRLQSQPLVYNSIFQTMSVCVQQAIAAIKQGEWRELGALFLQHHALQSALGVSNNLLNNLVDKLAAEPQIYGAKISGSGLGDCVIGLGHTDQQLFNEYPDVRQFPVVIESQGLTYASN